jgi:predicted Zn-dependent peptidase
MIIAPLIDRAIRTTVLPNGLRVVSEEMPHVRSVSAGIWIDSGSRHEVGAESGVSHFIEHMVFKGSRNRSAEEIARAMDGLGGSLDAFTGKELVSFNCKVLDEHLPLAFDVLSDMLINPAFREEDIEREKGVILEELKMEVDNPEYLVHETFSANFWKGHPLGRPILGTKETIKGFQREMVTKYYASVYTPANIVITAAGHVDHDRLVDLIAHCFGSVPAGEVISNHTPPRPTAKLVIKERKSLEQVHLLVGVPAIPIADDRRFAAYLMNTLLGGSMSSRLFQNIREQRGLVYSVFSEINSYRDAGCLTVYAGTSHESFREVIALIVEEFRRFKEEPVNAEELTRARNHLRGSLLLSLESTSSRMANLARQHLYFDRYWSPEELVQAIDRVTPDDILDISRQFFQPDNMALTAIGPLGGVQVHREDLAC